MPGIWGLNLLQCCQIFAGGGGGGGGSEVNTTLISNEFKISSIHTVTIISFKYFVYRRQVNGNECNKFYKCVTAVYT